MFKKRIDPDIDLLLLDKNSEYIDPINKKLVISLAVASVVGFIAFNLTTILNQILFYV